MERMTAKRKDGRWAITNNNGETPVEQALKLPQVIARLAAYEDTGLEPEEISELLLADEVSPEAKYAINEHADSLIKHLDALIHKDDSELKKYRTLGSLDHLKELVQAENDGRLVVWQSSPDDECIRKFLCVFKDCMDHPEKSTKEILEGYGVVFPEEAEAALEEKG